MDKQQPYDSSMKALFKDDAAELLPYLLPGTTLLDVLDIEMLRSALRADRVYRIHYHNKPHILQLEFQAGKDPKMEKRLLLYHADLLHNYEEPIISMVIYLFNTSTPTPPFRAVSGGKEVLSFHYQVLKLWEFEAQEYVDKHAITIYPLLPAMQCSDANILLQAIDELVQYYKGKKKELRERLLWFNTLLERAEKVIPETEKQKVRKHLDAFDQLLAESEFVRKQRLLGEQQGFAKGRTEGRTEGEVETSQQNLLDYLQVQYPDLAKQMASRIAQTKSAEKLRQTLNLLYRANNSEAAYNVLDTHLARQ